MWFFLVPLLFGFAIVWLSAFTAFYSRIWGERGGRTVTSILRNIIGIPLWFIGFVIAWRNPAQMLFEPGAGILTLGWLLIAAGSIPVIWGHLLLGMRTHLPSQGDKLVRSGLYAYVRHPIYAGGIPVFIGLTLIKPTLSFVTACILGLGWLIIQARLEEIDLLQRMAGYREYMAEVPRFFPRLFNR